MKKIFTPLALFLLFCIAACDKLPQNGKLDGMWQLMEQTTFNPLTTRNTKLSRIYWSFQLDMLMIHTTQNLHNGKTYDSTGLFLKKGDSLFIDKVFVHYYNNDSLITDPASVTLDTVGIHGNGARFEIERLNSKDMTLRSDFCRLVFKKI